MDDLFRDMIPHLLANLLTLMFAYAAIAYTRLERAGRIRDGGHLLAFLCLVIGIAGVGVYLEYWPRG